MLADSESKNYLPDVEVYKRSGRCSQSSLWFAPPALTPISWRDKHRIMRYRVGSCYVT